MFSLDQGFKKDAGVVSGTKGDIQAFVDATISDVMLNFVYLFVIKLIIS